MTEAEWLACNDPVPMFACLMRRSDRLQRLTACACCRRLWNSLADGSQRAIEATERYADGTATSDDLWNAYTAAEGAMKLFGHMNDPIYRLTFPDDQFDVLEVVDHAAEAVDGEEGMEAEHAAQANIVRDVFDYPFRPSVLNPSHRTTTVASLARAAYDERQLPSGELDPHRLAVLADALEEAGAPAELVAHLREPGPHVRGCWAVDLCLRLS